MLDIWALGVLFITIFIFYCYIRSNETLRILDSSKKLLLVQVNCNQGLWTYWKTWLLYLALIYNRRQKLSKNKSKEDDKKLEQMEAPQPLPISHPKAVDTVQFTILESRIQLMASITRRPKDEVEVVLMLHLPELGLLVHPLHPHTCTQSENGEKVERFACDNLVLQCEKPMRKWRLFYSGLMKLVSDNESLHHIRIEAQFSSDHPYFDVGNDADLWTLAKTLAREEWTQHRLDQLQITKHRHYEQVGLIKGLLKVDHQREFGLASSAIRSHSSGLFSNWSRIQRAMIISYNTRNGFSGVVGLIDESPLMSHLVVGFVVDKSGANRAVQEVHIDLAVVDEDKLAANFAVEFRANQEWNRIEASVEAESVLYFGAKNCRKVVQRFCSITLNGCDQGSAISQWICKA